MLSLVSEFERYLLVNYFEIVGKFAHGIDMGG